MENKDKKSLDEKEIKSAENIADKTLEPKAKKVKAKKEKGTPFYKKPGFRYSMMASILSIVFIIVIVAVNILASMLDARVNALQLDMTTSKDYSISDKNIDYIKKIDKKITVTVAATESYYLSSYSSFLSENYYYSDTSGGKYFNQTIQLLKKYPKINDKITVQFIDPTTPAFDDFSTNYKGKYTNGSIIVECTFNNSNGKSQSRYKILQADDLYETDSSQSQSTSYSDSNITGSKVETALTSALYYVSTEQQDKAAVVTGYGCDEATALQTILKDNNYDVEEISSLTTTNIADDIKLLIFVAPTSDLTPAEIKKLDNYMLGHKDYGRNILYAGSNTQHKLPNLDSFMAEWGLTFDTGTIYETDENYHSADSNTFMYLQDGGTDYTKDNTKLIYVCNDMRPITLKYTQSGSYYTYNIIKTYESTTVMPSGSKSSWTPGNSAKKQSYSGMALSTYAAGTDSNDKIMSSNILALASSDFYNSNYASTNGISNQDVLINMINNIVGRTEDVYSVTSKTISTTTFTVSEAQANIIKYICVGVVPVVVLVFGIFVVIRRKRK